MSELSPRERTQVRLIVESHEKMERAVSSLVDSSHAVALEQGLIVGKLENVMAGIGDINEHLRNLNGKVERHERAIHACEVDRTEIKTKICLDGTPVNQAVRDVRTEWRVWGIFAGVVFSLLLAFLSARVFIP